MNKLSGNVTETPDFCPNCGKEIRLPLYYWLGKFAALIIGFILGYSLR